MRDARGSAIRAPLVVAPSSIGLAGRALATIPQQTDRSGLTLWLTAGALRVTTVTWGFERDGDVVDRASVTVYGCGPGHLHLALFGEQGRRVEIRGNYVPIRVVEIGAGRVWRGSVPSPPDADGSGACIFGLTTDGRVGTSEIRFERGRRW